jgi:hypothetical protein
MTVARTLILFLLAFVLAACGEKSDIDLSPAPRGVEVPDHFLRFLNAQRGEVLNASWSEAYYRAVDPYGERATLEGWKAANNFDDCIDQVHVIFRDAKDLGYGRNMRACRHPDGRVAIFVDNYVVRIRPGSPTNYGPINVEAAILEDPHHMQGTNAIEFSPIDPTNPASVKVAKFFTFTPSGELNIMADLDGRGAKPMPQPCLLCHGATLLPWDADPIIASATPWAEPGVAETLKSAKLNQLELESFDYSSLRSGYSRAEQEEVLRRLNRFILDTFEEAASRPLAAPGRWWPDFAIEIANKRYADAIDVSGQLYQDDSVPCGWRVDPSLDADCVPPVDMPIGMRPEGVDLLYKRVVEPHCIACHSLRGTRAGELQGNDGNAINFSNYEKFIGYDDLILDYVYHRGVMPLSLRNYEKFWSDRCNGPSALMASFLPGFDRYDDQGCVIAPGVPVALPGADRTVMSPAILDASASLFARSWHWQVISTPAPGAEAGFSDSTSSAPQFSASVDGTYVVRLTVSNFRGSDSEDLVLTVDSAMNPTPTELTFVDHVIPVLRDPVYPGRLQRCVDCHSLPGQAGAYAGIPVIYDQDGRVYRDVLHRINLNDPENSMLLRKPTRDQHGGGKVIDRGTADGEALYRMLINWIRAGAPCGDDPLICAG